MYFYYSVLQGHARIRKHPIPDSSAGIFLPEVKQKWGLLKLCCLCSMIDIVLLSVNGQQVPEANTVLTEHKI